jgi:hypothetical protein
VYNVTKPFPGLKAFDSAQATLFETSDQLLLDGKAALKATGSEKDISSRRDLFSLLLKANMDADLPSTSRISDAEVVAREWEVNLLQFVMFKVFQKFLRFLLLDMKLQGAGMQFKYPFLSLNSISTALSWALHALSLNRGCQTKLREELLTVSSDNPTVEELNALPYLQQVIQETLRGEIVDTS